jgi:hypothetical protein
MTGISLYEYAFRVAEPKLLKSTTPTLQFKLQILVNENAIATIPGWRVSAGRITPPSHRIDKGAFVPNVVTDHAFWLQMIGDLVSESWASEPEYKAIQFPGVPVTIG